MLQFDEDVIVDFNQDFFKTYPHWKEAFSDVPSDNMWAYCYLYHKNSPFDSLTEKQKLDQVTRLCPRKINYSKYKKQEKLFEECVTDYGQKFMRAWKKKLEERDEYWASLNYKDDELRLERLLSNTNAIWKAYREAEKEMKKDEGTKVSGDLVESATEKGFI